MATHTTNNRNGQTNEGRGESPGERDRVREFYDRMKTSGAVRGLPERFDMFETAMQDSSRRRQFYDRIKDAGEVRGIPDEYTRFNRLFTDQDPEAPAPDDDTGIRRIDIKPARLSDREFTPERPATTDVPGPDLPDTSEMPPVEEIPPARETAVEEDAQRPEERALDQGLSLVHTPGGMGLHMLMKIHQAKGTGEDRLIERLGEDGVVEFYDLVDEKRKLQKERRGLRRDISREFSETGRAPEIDEERSERIEQLSEAISEVDSKIGEYKPDGLTARFADWAGRAVGAAAEMPAGILDFVALAAKELDDVLGTDLQPGEVSEQASAQMAEWIREKAATTFPQDPTLQDEFAGKLAGGLASFMSYALGGIGARAMRASGGAFATLAASGGGASQMYREAKEELQRADVPSEEAEEMATTAARWGVGPGIIQVFPIIRVLERYNRATRGELQRGINRLIESGKTGVQEAIVETLGQYGFNRIAREIYDENRDLFEGLGDAAGIGGGAGFLTDLILTSVGAGTAPTRGRRQQRPDQFRREPETPVEGERVDPEAQQREQHIQPEARFTWDQEAAPQQQLEQLDAEQQRLQQQRSQAEEQGMPTEGLDGVLQELTRVREQVARRSAEAPEAPDTDMPTQPVYEVGESVPVEGYQQTDSQGREHTYYRDTQEQDGMRTTQFTFHRSDKPADQRNPTTVPIEHTNITLTDENLQGSGLQDIDINQYDINVREIREDPQIGLISDIDLIHKTDPEQSRQNITVAATYGEPTQADRTEPVAQPDREFTPEEQRAVQEGRREPAPDISAERQRVIREESKRIGEELGGVSHLVNVLEGVARDYIQDADRGYHSLERAFAEMDERAEQNPDAPQLDMTPEARETFFQELDASLKERAEMVREKHPDLFTTKPEAQPEREFTPEEGRIIEEGRREPAPPESYQEIPKVPGRQIPVDFRPERGRERISGRYALIEAEDLKPSHFRDGSRNPQHRISEAQPRDRADDDIRAQPEHIARTLNPELVTGNHTAFYGAPVVTPDGQAIQGSGRSLALQMAYSEFSESAQNYRQHLEQHADQYGIPVEQIQQMSQPVLVREVDVSPQEAIRLGNIPNVAEAKTRPIDAAKAQVRNMRTEQRRALGQTLSQSHGETLGEMIDDVGLKILDQFPGLDRSGLVRDNKLTSDGKEFIKDAFTGLVFDSQANPDAIRQFQRLPHTIRTGIETSYGNILSFVGTEADLGPALQKAAEIIDTIRRSDDAIADVDQFMRQGNAFEGFNAERFTAAEAALADWLLKAQTKKLPKGRKRRQEYNRIFREIEDTIYGKNELFEQVPGTGTTAEGREQALAQTFGVAASPRPEAPGVERRTESPDARAEPGEPGPQVAEPADPTARATTDPEAPTTPPAMPRPEVSARQLQQDIRSRYGVELDIAAQADYMVLSRIVVPEGQREQGVGTNVMQDLVDYADQNNLTLFATPTSDFGGAKTRLVKFYRRFGFVPNKGRNKDFRAAESMVRPADQSQVESPGPSVARRDPGAEENPNSPDNLRAAEPLPEIPGNNLDGELTATERDRSFDPPIQSTREAPPEANEVLAMGTQPEVVSEVQKLPAKDDPAISRQDIVEHVIDKLNVAVGVGRGQGLGKNLGIYREKGPGRAIRLAVANDISTLAHEVGHFIHHVIFQGRTDRAFDSELLPLGRPTSRPSYETWQVRKEGQAEFVRHLLVAPDQARTKAPNYYQAFVERLEHYQEMRDGLDELGNMIRGYMAQDLVTQFESQIAYDENSTTRRGPQNETNPQYLYRKIFDRKIPLQRMRMDLEGPDAQADPELFSRDAFRLSQLNEGNRGLMMGWIQHGVRDTDGNLVAKGLNQIFEDNGITIPWQWAESARQRQNFDKYLIARRGKELYRQQREGFVDAEGNLKRDEQGNVIKRELADISDSQGGALGFTEAQADAVIEQLDTPEFQRAAEEIYAWNDAIVDHLVARGFISRENAAAVKEMNRNYVPLHRVMDHMEARATGSSSSLVDQPSLWNRLRGSGRRIKPAIETMVQNASRMVDMAERNYTAVQAFENIRKSEDGGAWADPVTRPMRPVKAQLESIRKDLEEAGLTNDVLGELDLEHVFTLWQPVRHNPSKQEAMIRVDGEPRIWQVHNETLYDALTLHNPSTTNVVDRILTLAKKVFRKGVIISGSFITGVSQQDQYMAMHNSRYGYAPLKLTGKEKGTSDYLKGMASMLRRDETYQLWLQSRGAISGIVDQSSDNIKTTMTDLGVSRAEQLAKNVLFPARWLSAMEGFSAVFENSTRVGEFSRGIEVEGRHEEGLARAGIAAREVGADYARGGEWAKMVGRYKAFFNAGLQGDLAWVQAARRNPKKFMLTGLVTMAIPTIALDYLLMNIYENEDYIEREDERQMYWLFPIGDPRTTTQWFRLRKPWKLGTYFGTIVPAALQRAIQDEDRDLMEIIFPEGEDAPRVIMDLMPSAIMPLIEVTAGEQGYVYYFKRPIDPYWDKDLEPWLRYDDRNSELEKKLGKTLNYSPRKIRHLMRGYSGTVGVELSDVIGNVIDAIEKTDKPPKPKDRFGQDWPGLSPFVSPHLSANWAKSVQDFYELNDEVTKKRRSFDQLEGEEADRYVDENARIFDVENTVRRAQRNISGYRKEASDIYADKTMSPEDKRTVLNQINKDIIAEARDVMEVWKEMEE